MSSMRCPKVPRSCVTVHITNDDIQLLRTQIATRSCMRSVLTYRLHTCLQSPANRSSPSEMPAGPSR